VKDHSRNMEQLSFYMPRPSAPPQQIKKLTLPALASRDQHSANRGGDPAGKGTPKPKARPRDKMSPASIAKLSNQKLIAHLKKYFLGPAKRLWRDHLPYLRVAHARFAQPGRRVPIKGRPLWGVFCKKQLGVCIRTVERWLSDKPPATKIRDKYDAVDIAHLERVAYVAHKVADDNPDDERLEPIRKAMRNRLKEGDKRHFWLTPDDVKAVLEAEFGPLNDVCPHPRPEGFNGLTMEWSDELMNYVNPIFKKTDDEGISDWVRKMIIEQAKGRDSTLMYPCYSWFHLLLNAGAEMKSMGPIHWLAIEDGTPQKASLPIV